MEALVLALLFFFFLFTSVPIAVAIGLTVISYLFVYPEDMSFISQNMYTALDSLPLLALPFFMLAGNIMEVGGLSRRLVNVANCLVGNATSGLAIVTIMACMFFGAISGSAPATVAAIGGIMIPAMVKYRYDKAFAAGLISAAGGLGIIIPPSIPLIIYSICTQRASVGDLFIGGIVPGIIVGLCLMSAAWWVGKKRGYAGTGQHFNLKVFLKTFWEAKWALFVPVLILGGIYGGAFTPTEASVVAVLYSLVVSLFVYRELQWKELLDIFANTGALVGTVFMLFGTAYSLSILVSLADIGTKVNDMILGISTDKLVVLLLINVFLLVVGMLMDTMSANLIFSALLLGIVEPLGVDPVHFGIIVTINLAMGFVTPPMAANAFLTSTITGVPVAKIFKESMPFIAAMFVALILVTYIPALTLAPVRWLH